MEKLKRTEEIDSNFLGEDWLIVKKQKVNILIPSLPGSSEPEQLQDGLLRELDNTRSDHLGKTGSEERLAISKDKPIMESSPNGVAAPVIDRMNMDARKLNDSQQRNEVIMVQESIRTVKQWRLNDVVLSDKMMKAFNLERKVIKAGGLSCWLTSLGLEQFISVFDKRKISKFQLVNLSMGKLKDMGVDAVGPRRKLLHAIECVCHPYCFESL